MYSSTLAPGIGLGVCTERRREGERESEREREKRERGEGDKIDPYLDNIVKDMTVDENNDDTLVMSSCHAVMRLNISSCHRVMLSCVLMYHLE